MRRWRLTTTFARAPPRARTRIEAIELIHLLIRECECQSADVLGDPFTMRRLGQHDEVVLETPANQDLRGASRLARRLPGLWGWTDVGRSRTDCRPRSPACGDDFRRPGPSVTEGVEVDLVGDGRGCGNREDLPQFGDVEVRDTDRASVPTALRLFHARPGPGSPPWGQCTK